MDSTIFDKTRALREYLDTHLNKVDAEINIRSLIAERTDLLGAFFNDTTDIYQRTIQFIRAYISIAPNYFEALSTLAEMDNIDEYTSPFLHDATNYFFDDAQNPANSLDDIYSLLSKAYMFHRMIEELNDRVALERQLALAPIDMAYTNLIAHTIIGDEEANLLDQDVLIKLELTSVLLSEKTERIFQNPATKALTEQRRDCGWKNVYEKWPFLTEEIN